MATDGALMLAAGRGDLAAFGEIVQRHQAAAWKAAYRFLGDAAEAEDVAQQALRTTLMCLAHHEVGSACYGKGYEGRSTNRGPSTE